jgi:hypothetical protein
MSWFGKKAVFPTESKWNLFQGENNGKPMIVRKNESARALKETGTFRNRIGVAVPLIDAREDGLPSPLELENLNAIEDALSSAFEADRRTILVLTITTSGMREFVLYSSNPERLESVLNELRGKFTRYEFQSYVADDKQWAMYAQFA